MRRAIIVSGVCVFLAAGLTADFAVAGQDIRIRLLSCEPRMDKPDGNDVFTKGYKGVGYHNTDNSHYMRVNVAFYKDSGQSIDDALKNVKRIYLCRFKGGAMTCPTDTVNPLDDSYVLYDKARGIEIDAKRVLDWKSSGDQDVPKDDGRASTDLKDLDWRKDADKDVAIVPRMQLEGADVPTKNPGDFSTDASKYGTCSNWSLSSQNPSDARFLVYSPTQLVADQYDICGLEGQKRWWGEGYAEQSECISPPLGEFVRQWMERLEDAQEQRLQMALPLDRATEYKPEEWRKLTWRNGRAPGSSDTNPIYLPSFVFVGPGIGLTNAYSASGGLRIAQHTFTRMNASALNDVRKAFPDKPSMRSIALTFHEYFHRLQSTWTREGDMPNWPSYVNESMCSADALNNCLVSFPGATNTQAHPKDAQCMNAGKLGLDGEAHYDYKNHQRDPSHDVITAGDSGIFWRYLYEQFSYPLPTQAQPSPAHPSGVASQIIHEVKTLNDRYSDEGADLVGYLYQGFAQAKDSKVTAFVAADAVLKSKLGRSFDDVVEDFHTALYLKDYTDSDDRWRFEWTHGAGFSATDLLSASKPFTVYELNGPSCDKDMKVCDGLIRTHRVLDSFKADGTPPKPASESTPASPGTPASPDYLPYGGTRLSAAPTYLGVYGTEAASVSLDASWVGKTMIVRAWDIPDENVRFRLFRISSFGNNLIPVLVTKFTAGTDPTTMREIYEWPVAITSATKELVLIASAGVQGGSFGYQFGKSAPTLAILSPQESNQALIGSPVSVTGRRPFLLNLSIRDNSGKMVYVSSKSDLTIEIPGCRASPSCTLSDSDYSIVPASGGNLMLVITVPTDFYPSALGEGTFGLKVTYAGMSDTKTNALRYSNKSEQLAATLVLDESWNMGAFGGKKMTAMKNIAKSLLASFVPAEDIVPVPKPIVSLVTYAGNATTRIGLTEMTPNERQGMEAAIDGLTAKGQATAIGDGLYEAQSGLAAKFDPSNNHPARELVFLLTDGKNTELATPETYYAKGLDASRIPTGDGDGEWYKDKPLYYHKRVDDKLRVPTLNAVGIGQDADLTTLDQITRLSGQHPIFVKEPDGNPSASPNQITLDLADGAFGAVDEVLDYSRVSSGRITGPAEEPDPNDPPSEFSIEVEPGVSELKVVVTGSSSYGYGGLGILWRPKTENGEWEEEPVTAESGDKSSRSYRVNKPRAGTWIFESTTVHGGDADVFVSASVLGSLKMFTFADARFRTAKDEVLAGSPVVLRAVGIDGGRAATSCAFQTATVTAPGASVPTVFWLADDGQHEDGAAGDGVFGGLYKTTATPGIYDVTFGSYCKSPVTDAWVTREQRSGFVVQLQSEDDSDGDGIPNAVESLCLNPYDPNDADLDFDGDGLSNRREFQLGTSPCRSDTDGGGLADGSEVVVGTDPFNAADDNMTAPLPELTPGNTKIHIHSGIVVGDATLEVETSPGTSGPWTSVSDAWIPGQNDAIHRGLINGTLYCYRLRLDVGARASAWSYPVCATPNGDATPPTISVVSGIQACGAAYVQPELAFSDSPYPSHAWNTNIDLGLSSTGVVAMRIWEGVGPAPVSAVWQTPNTKPVIKVPTTSSTISIQVRDGAGNLSKVAMLSVTCVQPECFFKPKDIGCCTEVATCGHARDYALFAESQLYVGDAVKLKNASGTAVPIANRGTGQTYMGVEALAGSLASVGPVDLRDRSKVNGAIECGGAVTSGNGVVVTGGTVERSTALQLPSLAKFAVKFPTSGGDQNLNVGQVRPLGPGSYGSISVPRAAELQLSTGTYYINNLTVESMGKVKVNSTNGPVYLYIKSGLNYRGAVTDTTGRYDRIFWGHFGSTPVSVEAPLVGTIVSPTAAVSLKTITGTTHRGSVYAKQLDIQAQALFVHYPFIGTWNSATSF